MRENYQSLGTTTSHANQRNYRMMYAGNDGLMIKDYIFLPSKGTLMAPVSAKRVCKGMPELSLPMLSKDGREFAAYDAKNQRSVIVQIGNHGQDCKVTNSIPAIAGKADFSPDGQRIAFHIDKVVGTGLYASPDTHKNDLNVVVLDRKSNQLSGLPTLPNENAYYPVFLDNDRLAYVVQGQSESGKTFSMIVTKLGANNLLSCRDCESDSPTGQHAAILGSIFGAKCGEEKINFQNSFADLPA